jgi:dynactin complex subunit
MKLRDYTSFDFKHSLLKEIVVLDEKESNKLALSELLNGNTALVFDLTKEELNLNQLFHNLFGYYGEDSQLLEMNQY